MNNRHAPPPGQPSSRHPAQPHPAGHHPSEWTPTVSVVMLNNFLAYWKQAGCDMDALYGEISHHAEHLSDVHYRVPLALVAALFDLAAAQLNDPVMGLKIGYSITPAQLGMLGSIVVSAPNALDALKTLKRYSCLMTDSGSFHMKTNKESVTIKFEPVTNVRLSYHQVDGILATFIKQIRWILGLDGPGAGQNLPIVLRLTHDDFHGRKREYEAILEASVIFNEPENVIEFSSRRYQWPPGLKDNLFHAYQLEMAEKKRDAIKQQVPFSFLVKQVLSKHADRETITLADVAYDLKISARYLQQHLQKEKKTFRVLLDEFKQERAVELLQNGELTIEEIAETLGYSEVSAFYRAFKRWTGLAPRTYATTQLKQNAPAKSGD